MHVKPSLAGFGVATALFSLVPAGVGCTSAHRDADASPSGPVRAGEPAAGAAPETPPEPVPHTTDELDPDVWVERFFDELLVYGPFPGEVLTDSPLDELASVSDATLDPATIRQERERTEAAEPTYDIPVVTNDEVLFWLDYYSNRRHESFQAGLERSGRYMHVFRRVFEEEGLPLDLIYMAHVESAYKTTAYSRARARGIFQFITGTGRRYGLRIDYWADERLDPEKSARASAAYLKDLYAEFGDWYLALAGYNAGEGKIRRAIARTGQSDFWEIAGTRYIRRETKNYVPAILAAVMISKDPEKYGFDLEPDPAVAYESVDIAGAADLQVLARCAGTDVQTMKSLNPALRRYQTPPHATTTVHVPIGAGERTLARLAEVPEAERVLWVRHRVRSGDTLYELARDYGVSVSAIQQTNKMGRRTMIRVGDEIVIPTVAAGSYPAPGSYAAETLADPGEASTYRVRRGDTLSGIATRYRTTAAAIASVNGIGVGKILHPGDRLTVVAGGRSAGQAQSIAGGSTTTEPLRVAAAGAATGHGGSLVHTVRRGDSLWRIANRYDTTVEVICSLNRISKNATLRPGTRLTIRYD